MKRVCHLVGALLVAGTYSASAASPKATPDVRFRVFPEAGSPVSWGPIVNGIQLGLQIASPLKSYTFGQSVAFLVTMRNLGHKPFHLSTEEPLFREKAIQAKADDDWAINALGVDEYGGSVPTLTISIPAGGSIPLGRPCYAIRPRFPEDKSQVPAFFAEGGSYEISFDLSIRSHTREGMVFNFNPGWHTGSVPLLITGTGRPPELRKYESAGLYIGDSPPDRLSEVMEIASQELRLVEAINTDQPAAVTPLPGAEVDIAKYLENAGTLGHMKGFHRTKPIRVRLKTITFQEACVRVYLEQSTTGTLDNTSDSARMMIGFAKSAANAMHKPDKLVSPVKFTGTSYSSQEWQRTPDGWKLSKLH